MYYTTGVPGTGTVRLTATRSGGVSDSGWVNVTVLSEGGAALVLKNHNREIQDRSLCLTIGGAGEAAAVGCGHLVVSHRTPGYATLGRTRALTLLYNSQQASPGAVLPVTVIQRANVAQPSSVFVRLRLTADTTVGDENCALKKEVYMGRVFNARPDEVFRFTFVADPTIKCRR